MNKIVLAFALLSLLVSCGNKKEKVNEDFITTDATVEATQNDAPEIGMAFKKGADLIAANDCLACHKVEEKVVGPSYQDVANKYSSADENKLVNNIINGCEGNWGDIPMVAHPDLPKEDVSEMVKYILSLKK
jgi:cytochrome c